jgi:hypothetical protein
MVVAVVVAVVLVAVAAVVVLVVLEVVLVEALYLVPSTPLAAVGLGREALLNGVVAVAAQRVVDLFMAVLVVAVAAIVI